MFVHTIVLLVLVLLRVLLVLVLLFVLHFQDCPSPQHQTHTVPVHPATQSVFR